MACLTTNQRSGNDSPRFMGINSRRRSLCPLDVDSVENSDFRLDHNCRDRAALREIFARDAAYNSGRDPAIFVACARAHSSSKERKREARPFSARGQFRGFSTESVETGQAGASSCSTWFYDFGQSALIRAIRPKSPLYRCDLSILDAR